MSHTDPPAKVSLTAIRRPFQSRRFMSSALVLEILSLGCLVAIATYPYYKNLLHTVTTHQPERLTELYFPLNRPLPTTYVTGEKLTVHFVIHNLEYRDTTYPFQIALVSNTGVGTIVYSHSVAVRSGQTAVVSVPITIPLTTSRVSVNVKLVNVQQSIHFWLTRRP